jgi:acetyl-CoA acetyltransferase
MQIRLNEKITTIATGTTLASLADSHKPGSDVQILNGFPAPGDTPLHDGDTVFLIRRGEQPDAEELESLLAARHTPGVHARVKCATVGIAGVGGLGSAVAVALARVGVGRLIIADFDVVELNEAFAAQSLAVLRQLGLPDDADHVNPNGGAIALGHPLGASGGRLMITALNQLEVAGGKRALCTMCIGVGQGIALAIERV